MGRHHQTRKETGQPNATNNSKCGLFGCMVSLLPHIIRDAKNKTNLPCAHSFAISCTTMIIILNLFYLILVFFPIVFGVRVRQKA